MDLLERQSATEPDLKALRLAALKSKKRKLENGQLDAEEGEIVDTAVTQPASSYRPAEPTPKRKTKGAGPGAKKKTKIALRPSPSPRKAPVHPTAPLPAAPTASAADKPAQGVSSEYFFERRRLARIAIHDIIEWGYTLDDVTSRGISRNVAAKLLAEPKPQKPPPAKLAPGADTPGAGRQLPAKLVNESSILGAAIPQRCYIDISDEDDDDDFFVKKKQSGGSGSLNGTEINSAANKLLETQRAIERMQEQIRLAESQAKLSGQTKPGAQVVKTNGTSVEIAGEQSGQEINKLRSKIEHLHGILKSEVDVNKENVGADNGQVKLQHAPGTLEGKSETQNRSGDELQTGQQVEVAKGKYSYDTPLRAFAFYKFHPLFSRTVGSGKRLSLTFNHKLDPDRALCPFETAGGTCNADDCEYQHFPSQREDERSLLKGLIDTPLVTGDPDDQDYDNGLKMLLASLAQQGIIDDQDIIDRVMAYRQKVCKEKGLSLLLSAY